MNRISREDAATAGYRFAILWLVLVCLAGACYRAPVGAAVPTTTIAADATPSPVLDISHTGWKAQHCQECHNLPVENHEDHSAWDCSGCHGGNGACLPIFVGREGEHPQSLTSQCKTCHETMHDYDQNHACAVCHFAGTGTVDCSKDEVGDTPPGMEF